MSKKKPALYLIPIILAMTVIPLIVRLYSFNSGLGQFSWYPETSMVEDKQDFFLYYKSVAITVLAVIMCAILVWRYIKKKKAFKWGYELAPVLAYAVLTFFSSVFSQYRYFSFHGVAEMFESVWVLLGYCVILFYSYELINTIEDVDFVMRWLTVGLAVMLVIGVMQAFGKDPFTFMAVKKLIVDSKYWNDLDSFSIIFEQGRVFLTLYNPNYVASYFALMIPVEIALLIKNKNWIYRVIYLVMIAASLLCLLASGNRSGIVAFVATIALAIIMLFKHMLKAWKVVIPAAAAAAVIFAVFLSRNNIIIQKFIRLFNMPEKTPYPISKIVTGDEEVVITYMQQEFHVSYDIDDAGNINVSIMDADKQMINSTLDGETFTYAIQDARFPDFAVQVVNLEDEIAINVKADYRDWYFQKRDGSYYYYNVYGRWDKVNNAPHVAENFLSQTFEARGDIWSKTIPLLKNCLIFGYGADTFTMAYPQDDYVDKAYKGSQAFIDAKPHCYYLQVAVQSGLPALLAVLILYVWYFATSFQLYWKAGYENGLEIVGAGLMFATFAYLVSSIANDSTVGVSPIHWAMLGIGIAINEIIKKQKVSQEPEVILAGEKCQTEPVKKQVNSSGEKPKTEPVKKQVNTSEQKSKKQAAKPGRKKRK